MAHPNGFSMEDLFDFVDWIEAGSLLDDEEQDSADVEA